METQYFGQFLEERLKEKGVGLKKLSEISGISLKHLKALSHDEFSTLPPAPYIRGYINKLGELIGFNSNEWWEKIRMTELDASPADSPPTNKFVKRSPMKKAVASAFVILIVCAAFVFASPRIFGKPTITISYPDQNPAVTASDNITLVGLVTNGSRVYVNGESVEITTDGLWEKTISLGSGINPVEIKAKKFLGGETTIIQQILYEPTANTSLNPYTPMSGI
ncbi:MAG: helix-turn-helix domain-containing protein [Patescibacteria group bacterium]